MRKDSVTLADMLDVPLRIDPSKVAVNFEGAETTYRELDKAGNRVANALVDLGAQPGDELTERQVIDYCREHLAVFKCPRLVSFRDELPKSASGKVLKRVLREQERGTS